MASYSPPNLDCCSQTQAPDSKKAMKAIANAAKALRILLTDNNERLEVLIQQGLLRSKNTKTLIKDLQENIGQDPALYWVLVREVENFKDGRDAAQKLRANFPQPETLGDLRRRLSAIKDLNPCDEVIKSAINDAIEKKLKVAANKDLIENELQEMNKEELISSDLLQWAITETMEKYRQIHETTDVDHDTLIKQCSPIKLDNDDLYHASLCSTVVNTAHDTDQCKKLLQSLSYRSLKEVSVSQSDNDTAFPKCMIATTSNGSNAATCYVAFKNISNFKIWELLSDVQKSTFGKVLECQIEKFPTLYLENVIRRRDKVVLTGFSFGGVLAQMLAAQLWLLPHIHTDQLMSNVICITFGQPLIQSDLLTNVVDFFPEFENNIHVIGSEDDGFPYIMEKLDQLTFKKEVGLANVLVHLSRVQEFCNSVEEFASSNKIALPSTQPELHSNTSDECSAIISSRSDPTSTTVQDGMHGDEFSLVALPNSIVVEAQQELERLLRSQHDDQPPAKSSAPKKHLITFGESGVNVVEMNKKLEESVRFNRRADKMCQACFDQHSAGVYYRAIKKYAYNHQPHQVKHEEISSEFLYPIIDHVKVTQYGSDAIIVINGKRLWFVHSIDLASLSIQPFQVQDVSVSFRAKMNDFNAFESLEESQVVIFSHFCQPITQKCIADPNPSSLSPRGKQIASLEPARLLELAFIMTLLEKSPKHINCSAGNLHTTLPPFFNYFKQFLHELVSVVPFESILCAIAHCNSRRTAELCTQIIKKFEIDFQFSLTTYASLFVAAFKVQHQNMLMEPGLANFLDQQPFEECAYFMWLKAKYHKKNSTKGAVDSFSKEVFSDPFFFDSQTGFCSETLYLLKVVQCSLKQVNSLSEVNAVSNKSAADLYKWNRVDSSSRSKQELGNLKSPVSVIVEGREILHQSNNTTPLQQSEEVASKNPFYEKMMEVLHNARGNQFDACLGVLCGFMYQHVRVPFTENNPMTLLKSLYHKIAPYTDAFKNDPDFWGSILKRCQRAISKGSKVVERTYDAKLKFLVTNIDPESKANSTPTSSEYSMYTLEKKLEELCSERGIVKDKSVEQIVYAWKSYFRDCPLANVTSSHQSLITQWIKWSLLVHELRLTLEKHITIAIPGLVNSGKTQLIRSLFGLDVKAGTTELRRTIVPFMYSLAPDVKNVHVVDLPGADDSDKNVSQLTDFLKFISQIVVFVVSYDKAHTKDAKKWLDLFEKGESKTGAHSKMSDDYNVISDYHFESTRLRDENEISSVPVLMCMTFADRLFAEMLDEDGKYNEARIKKDVAKHFEKISSQYYEQGMWKPKGKRTLGYYCFNLSQTTCLEESDMKAVGIGVPSDVGEWICKQLREEICESDTADKLEAYFKQSCRQLKAQ